MTNKALLPYQLFQIQDGEPSLVGSAKYIERKGDNAFIFELELSREENRALCQSVHACESSGIHWTVMPDYDGADSYDGEITLVEMVSPPCCKDEGLVVHIVFKLVGEDND